MYRVDEILSDLEDLKPYSPVLKQIKCSVYIYWISIIASIVAVLWSVWHHYVNIILKNDKDYILYCLLFSMLCFCIYLFLDILIMFFYLSERSSYKTITKSIKYNDVFVCRLVNTYNLYELYNALSKMSSVCKIDTIGRFTTSEILSCLAVIIALSSDGGKIFFITDERVIIFIRIVYFILMLCLIISIGQSKRSKVKNAINSFKIAIIEMAIKQKEAK